MWRRRASLGALLFTLAGTLVAVRAPGARATDSTRTIAPGIVLRSFTRGDPALGPQEIRVLRFRLDDPRIHLRPVLAQDYGSRRLSVSQTVLRSNALAGVNGNFFTAGGNPRGIFLTNGILRSEPEAAINGARFPRAAWRIDGASLVFGRPSSRVTLTRGPDVFGLNGLDRTLGYLGNPDETVLETSLFDANSSTPPAGVDVVLDHLDPVKPNVDLPASVVGVHDGPGPIPPSAAVVSASGRNADQVRSSIAVGNPVQARVEVDDPGFASAQFADAGGPWVLRGSAPVPRQEMLDEGFSVEHLDTPAPRTAIGQTADGSALLVTVDGREPGRSMGATMDGLGQILRELGATDAISVDGGGSTEMSVDGLLMNLPSDKDAAGRPGVERPVADTIGVFFDVNDRATRRLAGADRVETAIQASRERATAQTVLLATTSGYADALVGGPLAASLNAPVLLTPPDHLDLRVADEIRRLGATSATVLGGSAALGPQVDADLAARGVSVRRLAGPDRYSTAAAVAGAQTRGPTVLVASGEDYPDALSAGAVGLPVLLTGRTSLPAATRAALGSSTAVVVGGAAAVATDVLPGSARLAGPDRYATSAVVADWAIGQGLYTDTHVLVARGDDYPDALVGGALHRPLLLVGRFGLDASGPTWDWLRRHGATTIDGVLLGGRTALSTMTEIQVDEAISP